MYQVRKTIILLLSVLMMTPLAAHAAVLEDFYRVEIPARENQDREQALRQAFDLMLTRQAGSEAADSETVSEAAQDPRAYMRRIAGTDAGGVRVDFDPAALRELLTGAGLSMLGPNRPTVMLWAIEDNAVGYELLSQGSDWAGVLTAAAAHRAVALSLPLADLEDRALVDVQDIRQADDEILKQASQRYDPGVVLALTITEAAEGVVLDWNGWLNGQNDSGRVSAGSSADAADKLMLEVADLVLRQYAVAPPDATAASRWEVVVRGISNVDEFAGLQRTLQQLGSKRMPQVLSVEGDRVRLAVDFSGTESQLERLLALDQRLRRIPAPEPEPEGQAEQPAATTAGEGPLSPGGAVDDPARAGLDEPEPIDQSEDQATPDVQTEMAAPEPNLMFFRWR